MQKIGTLFKRNDEGTIAGPVDFTRDEYAIILNGKAVPTIKKDGACCCILKGGLYKRYDAKNGKKPPEGAIPSVLP